MPFIIFQRLILTILDEFTHGDTDILHKAQPPEFLFKVHIRLLVSVDLDDVLSIVTYRIICHLPGLQHDSDSDDDSSDTDGALEADEYLAHDSLVVITAFSTDHIDRTVSSVYHEVYAAGRSGSQNSCDDYCCSNCRIGQRPDLHTEK